MKGGPVFYNKKLLAICEEISTETLLICLEVREFVRGIFIDAILEDSNIIEKKQEDIYHKLQRDYLMTQDRVTELHEQLTILATQQEVIGDAIKYLKGALH